MSSEFALMISEGEVGRASIKGPSAELSTLSHNTHGNHLPNGSTKAKITPLCQKNEGHLHHYQSVFLEFATLISEGSNDKAVIFMPSQKCTWELFAPNLG